jgi:hypothetical protein
MKVGHFLRPITLPACDRMLLTKTMIDTIVVVSDLAFSPLHDLSGESSPYLKRYKNTHTLPSVEPVSL